MLKSHSVYKQILHLVEAKASKILLKENLERFNSITNVTDLKFKDLPWGRSTIKPVKELERAFRIDIANYDSTSNTPLETTPGVKFDVYVQILDSNGKLTSKLDSKSTIVPGGFKENVNGVEAKLLYNTYMEYVVQELTTPAGLSDEKGKSKTSSTQKGPAGDLNLPPSQGGIYTPRLYVDGVEVQFEKKGTRLAPSQAEFERMPIYQRLITQNEMEDLIPRDGKLQGSELIRGRDDDYGGFISPVEDPKEKFKRRDRLEVKNVMENGDIQDMYNEFWTLEQLRTHGYRVSSKELRRKKAIEEKEKRDLEYQQLKKTGEIEGLQVSSTFSQLYNDLLDLNDRVQKDVDVLRQEVALQQGLINIRDVLIEKLKGMKKSTNYLNNALSQSKNPKANYDLIDSLQIGLEKLRIGTYKGSVSQAYRSILNTLLYATQLEDNYNTKITETE